MIDASVVYVIDASVVVAAALSPAGTPRRAVTAARAHGTIALSSAVYDEIAAVLTRPKFAALITLDRQLEILELLAAAALWREPTTRVQECRDIKDNKYLDLALATAARAIISGDDDLLVLDPWRTIRILSPAAFLDALASRTL